MKRKRWLKQMEKADRMREKERVQLERSLDPDEYWRKKERKCWWSWPLGHVWQRATSGTHRTCLNCGRQESYEYVGYNSDWVRQKRVEIVEHLLAESYVHGFIELDELEARLDD